MTIERCGTGSPIALWIIDLREPVTPAGVATLSPGERARAARFRATADRRRYVAAHVALRRLIGEAVFVDPARLRFATDERGKPRVTDCGGIHFSLSYAVDRAVVGLSTAGAIGVDAETCRAIADVDELASLHFSASEVDMLERLLPADRSRAFLRGWTRKEACLKAIGTGLSLPAASFTCGIDHARRGVTVEEKGRTWTIEVASVAAPTADMLMAWALVQD